MRGARAITAAATLTTVLALSVAAGTASASNIFNPLPPVVNTGPRGTGLTQGGPTVLPKSTSGSLPTTADLRSEAVPIGNQGGLGSCAAWAIGYAMLGWYANHTNHTAWRWENQRTQSGKKIIDWLQPMFVFHTTGKPYYDKGSTSDATFSFLSKWGIPPSRSSFAPGNDSPYYNPPQSEINAAARFKIKPGSWTVLFSDWNGRAGTKGMAMIKDSLRRKRPVAVSISTYSWEDILNASESQVVDVGNPAEPAPKLKIDHEVLVLAYDKKGIWIQNSWGTSVGYKGWYHVSWRFAAANIGDAIAFNTDKIWVNP